jgi:hypothetical protein
LKSYGPAWEGSTLDVLVQGRFGDEGQASVWKELHSSRLHGFHSVATSVNYIHHADLANVSSPISSVRATFTIGNGTRFQINGLALCNSPLPLVP